MEPYIPISFLNDFIFCPRSIYFHQLYGKFDTSLYQKKPQVASKAAHKTIDKKTYSTRKDMLQGMEIYCERYNLCGKIDLFDTRKGKLIERKRQVKRIYDGYIFQVYAHYHALTEMGYKVCKIVIYDMTHNKNYPILLPTANPEMQQKFEKLIQRINEFNLHTPDFKPVKSKCKYCIYANLCDYSLI